MEHTNGGGPAAGSPKKKKNVKEKRFSILRLIGRLFLFLFTLGVIGVLTTVIFFQIFMTYVNTTLAPTLDVTVEEMTLQLSSTLYDGDGNAMRTLYSAENRELVSIDKIPDHMINALIAIEDHRFWEHHGVDWEGTLAAFYKTFTSGSTRGGSTITQQLLREITEDDEVTVKRKVREIFRALEFEKKTSKEDILELYLNYVYFGQSCYGVQSAAKTYFGKDVSELDLAESAAIIGITNNPYRYDPFLGFTFKQSDGSVKTSIEMNKGRQEVVLNRMAELGIISEAECEAAKAEKLVFTISDEYKAAHRSEDGEDGEEDGGARKVYSWFEDAVIEDAIKLVMEAKGCSEKVATSLVYSGGYHVYTTLDPDIQEIVDRVYLDRANFNYPSAKGTPLDSAITVVDPYTGDVVAMAGGVGEKEQSRILNLATARRPCGSAIKPVSVYAPAFDANVVSPASVLDDYPITLSSAGTGYPRNSNGRYKGMTLVSQAITSSTNTIAARTFQALGAGASYEFMVNNLGFNLVMADMDVGPLAMGGLTYGVTTQEMAAAFASFANEGMYNKPRTITRILDNDGNVVVENSVDSREAMKPTTAYLINKWLRNVVTNGTGGGASFSGMTIAGKTGTTSDNFDRYFAGYTPYYAAAVWVGYKDSNERINASVNPAAAVWKLVMEPIHADLENKSFPERPAGIVSATVCMDCGKKASSLCSADVRGGRVVTMEVQEGAVPTEECTCHVAVEVCSESGMLASEFCPEESRVTRTYINPDRDYIELSPGYVTSDYVVVPAHVITAEDEGYTVHSIQAQGVCTLHDENTPQLPPEAGEEDENGTQGGGSEDVPNWLFPSTTQPVPPNRNDPEPSNPTTPGQPTEPATPGAPEDNTPPPQRPSWLDPPAPDEPDEPSLPPEE